MSLTWLLTACTLALIPIALYVVPHVAKVRAKRSLRKRCGKSRSLVLTYDDGPSVALTPLVLDELARWNVKATFFVVGKHAAAHPELVDRIATEGHEIGCHTYHHRHPWLAGPLRARADVDQGFRSLDRWVAADGLFRPPHGKLDLLTWLATLRRRAKLAWWTFDTGDTWLNLPAVDEVVEGVASADGGVILMHDADRGEERSRFVVDLTRRLCAHAADAGMSVAPLGSVLGGHDAVEVG